MYISLFGGQMKEKISHIALISVGILSSLILLVAFVDYLLPVLSPFLIAWLIAALTVSPAHNLSVRIKAPERVIRLIISVVATLIFFFLVALLIWQVSTALWRFLADIGEGNRLYDMLSALFSSDMPIFGELFPPELAAKISSAVGELISDCLSLVAGWITSFASALPQFFFFILVTLISLVYFALDYDKIAGFVTSLLPDRATAAIRKIRDSFISVIKKYICSYSLIMLITYSVILIGLWLLRVDHAPVVALFIALLDILPIIGVGTVLVPWSIFELAGGNRFLGIGLLLLFVLNAVIRQLSEPRIVGKSLDLHPIITLMMIYIGYALFGFWGMLILPVAAVSIGAFLKQDDSAEVA